MEDHCENAIAECRTKYDIIGSLPSELVIRVVKYLNEIDIVQCQMVSKQWRSIFLSDTILNSVLPRTLAALGIESAKIQSANVMSYIRWLGGLQLASPVKKVFLPLYKARDLSILCHSRRLFYVIRDRDPGCNEVVMLDLETGKRSTFSSEKYIKRIWVSGRYLFMIVEGRDDIAVWDVHTSQKLWETVLWSDPVHITVAKDKAIIVPQPDYRPYPHVYRPLQIWDLQSNESIVFDSFLNLHLCHVDAGKDILITFEISWQTGSAIVTQTTWTLTDAKKVHQKQFNLPLGDRPLDEENTTGRHPVYGWCCEYGQKTITLVHFQTNPDVMLHLTYDYAIDRLSARWIDYSGPIPLDSTYDLSTSLTPDINYRWFTPAMFVEVGDASTETSELYSYQFDYREATARDVLCVQPTRPRPLEDPDSLCEYPFNFFSGDREVVAVPSVDGVQLWFFNPDFVPDLPDAGPFVPMEESG